MTKSYIPTTDDLSAIEQYTTRKLDKDEIFTFEISLCNNDVDRDFERFNLDSLNTLATLFEGVTGIFDHDPKGENQTARIYKTEVVTCSDQTNSLDEPFSYLKGYAYMMRTDKNASLILEIEGGIKKEVSISCSVAQKECSICHKDFCNHQSGSLYDGNLCFFTLLEPTDAYEWSFVAVPAQVKAGVICTSKGYSKIGGELLDIINVIKSCDKSSLSLTASQLYELKSYVESLEQKAVYGERFKEELITKVAQLNFLDNPNMDSAVFNNLLQKMSIEELTSFESALQSKNICPTIQLSTQQYKL